MGLQGPRTVLDRQPNVAKVWVVAEVPECRAGKRLVRTQANKSTEEDEIYLMLDSKSFHRRQNSSWSVPDVPIVVKGHLTKAKEKVTLR